MLFITNQRIFGKSLKTFAHTYNKTINKLIKCKRKNEFVIRIGIFNIIILNY